MPMDNCRRRRSRGAAVVEFALVLPFLLIMFVVGSDFARVYRCSQIVADCARTGAMYLSNPDVSDKSPFASLEQAVLSGAGELSPPPTITSGNGFDSRGDRYHEVTVSYTFALFSRAVGAPQTLTVTRSVRARMYPAAVREMEGE